jgi:hypothetical protein
MAGFWRFLPDLPPNFAPRNRVLHLISALPARMETASHGISWKSPDGKYGWKTGVHL